MDSSRVKARWDKEARTQLKSALNYIEKTSPQNAAKVKREIIEVTEKAALHPEIFSLDKYKTDNDGSFRAFEKHRYRVAYRVYKDHIVILRIRHTSMAPLSY
jgi:plasmid stabilization system protein ParE